jgi:hypothetical protein
VAASHSRQRGWPKSGELRRRGRPGAGGEWPAGPRGSVSGLRWGRGTTGEGAQRHSWVAAAGSSAPAKRRLGGKSERVGELQQMPEEVGDALVGQCGGPALVLAAAASDGGARAGHKELGWLGMRGIGGGGRFIVDACLLVIDGPTAASRGACGRTNGGRTCGIWSAHER